MKEMADPNVELTDEMVDAYLTAHADDPVDHEQTERVMRKIQERLESEDGCDCFNPGSDNAAECGLRADERDPALMRRLWAGDYDDEDLCRCACHAVEL